MTIAYFDCFSGISGDMTLGALVDAGVRIDALRAELAKLGLPGYEISAEKVTRSGLSATRVHVLLDKQEQPERHLHDIDSLIEGSKLAPSIKKRSRAIFRHLAEAEAAVGQALEEREHAVFVAQADAPPCHECGSIMVRNGACYACANCGATSGCS